MEGNWSPICSAKKVIPKHSWLAFKVKRCRCQTQPQNGRACRKGQSSKGQTGAPKVTHIAVDCLSLHCGMRQGLKIAVTRQCGMWQGWKNILTVWSSLDGFAAYEFHFSFDALPLEIGRGRRISHIADISSKLPQRSCFTNPAIARANNEASEYA
jgi:hypothetical protein